jgi:acetyltransferase
VDQDSDISIVAVVSPTEEEGTERIIGAGRYLLNRTTNEAEFGLLVHDDWQHRGIGIFLFNHLTRIAKSKGVDAFVAYVHPRNQPMIRFIHKTDRVFESHLSLEDEEYIFKLRL